MANKSSPLKILVTGGAGFVGSHLVERLVEDGHTIVILDHFSKTAVYERYLKTYRKPHEVVRGDLIGDFDSLVKYFKNIDVVFHLAGRNKNSQTDKHPALYHDANVTATMYTLEASRRGGAKRFVYMASTTCYGPNAPLPTRETAPVDPRTPYALTKYLGEAYAFHWEKVYKLPVVSLRVFSIYGPRKNSTIFGGFFLSKFIDQMKAGKPITIEGDGSQSRDLIYISDVINALIMASQSTMTGEVFNVGTGVSTSMNEIIKILGTPRTLYNAEIDDAPHSTQADITKITTILGWKPSISIREGIQRTVAYEA